MTRARAGALAWAGRLLGGGMVALAVSSHFAYTTAGLDFEVESPAGVEVAYYRLRWDDGATWAGRAVQPVPRPARPLDRFDPGGTLLARPARPDHPRRWNRWGFWWIARPADDPYVPLRYPGATASRWVAVPSWLVILGCVGPAALRRAGRSRRRPRPGLRTP